MIPKKIKVKITDKVHGFQYNNVRYVPGDIVEIPARLFRADFMTKVLPPAPKKPEPEAPKEEPKPEVPDAHTADEESPVLLVVVLLKSHLQAITR